MMKASIELASISKSFKLRFSLIVKDDENNKRQFELINKFNFGGNDYIKIRPYPFLTIDISSSMDKKNEWSSNQSFNMNKKDLFFMIQNLKRLMKNFVTHKDLFYYDNNKLVVNKELADELKEVFVSSNKTILMQACVVTAEDNESVYEGMFLSINSVDYFSYLTYSEMEYLLYELEHVNMTQLAIDLINSVKILEQKEAEKIVQPPVVEEKPEEIVDKKPLGFFIQNKKELPNI